VNIKTDGLFFTRPAGTVPQGIYSHFEELGAIVCVRIGMKSRNQSWTDEDTERLRRHIQAGGSASTAAVRFKRTEAAVRAQAKEMGLRFLTIRERRIRALGTPGFVTDYSDTR
jgi:hypothetical protein